MATVASPPQGFSKLFSLATYGPRLGLHTLAQQRDFALREYAKTLAGTQDLGSLSTFWLRAARHTLGGQAAFARAELRVQCPPTRKLDEKLDAFVQNVKNLRLQDLLADPDMRAMFWSMPNTERKGIMAYFREKIDPTCPKSFPDLANGNGKPVYLIRGLLTTLGTMKPLGRFLTDHGYNIRIEESHAQDCGWPINSGTSHSKVATLKEEIEAFHAETGEPVTLIGWSHGGHLSHLLPYLCAEGTIDHVISLGGPINPQFAEFHKMVEYMSCIYEKMHDRASLSAEDKADIMDKLSHTEAEHPDIHFTNVYSVNDGIVPVEAAMRPLDLPNVTNIESRIAHILLGNAPSVRGHILSALNHDLNRHATPETPHTHQI